MAETTSDQPVEKPPVFAQVSFHIVLSDSLDTHEADKITQILSRHGGVEVARTSTGGDIDLAQISHIISSTSDFSKYSAAEAVAGIAIVTPQWVYESVRRSRLVNVRQYTPDPRKYFSGLVVTSADLPEGDKDAIYAGVIQLGGQSSSSVTRLVTHIVALNLDSDKCQTALSKGLTCKIVLPHWFDDCLKLGQRIDESPYLLPNAEILRSMQRLAKDPVSANIDTSHLEGASSTQPAQLPTPGNSPHSLKERKSVLKDKHVMLSLDLGISTHLRKTLEGLVVTADGILVNSTKKAAIFICQYREGEDYMEAYSSDCEVGNLAWLYYLITHGTWTSPLRRLLHYPVARKGLADFKNYKICLSNYNGDARVYLENLAKAIGSEFTKTMTQENTHLITAHTVSEKCKAAREWNVNVVNHLWLEESYAKWQAQSITNPRYTHFPARTNLSQVVGQTPVDKMSLPKSFRAEDNANHESTPKPTPLPNNISAKLQPSNAQQQARSSPAPQNESLHPRGSAQPTPQATKEKRRHSEGIALRTPAAKGLGGKESETPSSTGSRLAKEVAAARLHDAAKDMNQFLKETKRVGGPIYGGRRSTDEVVQDPKPSRKRTKSVEDETEKDAAEEERSPKKQKKSKSLPMMRLMLSGYQRWVGNSRQESDDKYKLRDLRIMTENQSSNCTHIAVPRIIRTQKFISAVSAGAVVLSTEFVDKCLESSKRPDPEKFLLHDDEGEYRLGCSLSETRSRALENKGQLLKGYHVFCTEHPAGNYDIYKNICEANGGNCILFKGRQSLKLASTAPRSDSDTSNGGEASSAGAEENVYLISTGDPEDKKLWPRFNMMVTDGGKIPRIVKIDWITDALLRQRVDWADEYLQEGSNAEQ